MAPISSTSIKYRTRRYKKLDDVAPVPEEEEEQQDHQKGIQARKKVPGPGELTLEEYCAFYSKVNQNNITSDQINDIVRDFSCYQINDIVTMHGFRKIYRSKADIVEALSSVSDDLSNPFGTSITSGATPEPFTEEEVATDIDEINWKGFAAFPVNKRGRPSKKVGMTSNNNDGGNDQQLQPPPQINVAPTPPSNADHALAMASLAGGVIHDQVNRRVLRTYVRNGKVTAAKVIGGDHSRFLANK